MNPCPFDVCTSKRRDDPVSGYVPDDHNECTVDTCSTGMPVNDGKPAPGNGSFYPAKAYCLVVNNVGACQLPPGAYGNHQPPEAAPDPGLPLRVPSQVPVTS